MRAGLRFGDGARSKFRSHNDCASLRVNDHECCLAFQKKGANFDCIVQDS